MEKRSERFFVTFVSRPVPFIYIPPTGNKCGRKPIAMYVISGNLDDVYLKMFCKILVLKTT